MLSQVLEYTIGIDWTISATGWVSARHAVGYVVGEKPNADCSQAVSCSAAIV